MVDPVSGGGHRAGGSSPESQFNTAVEQLESGDQGKMTSALGHLKQLAESDGKYRPLVPLIEKQQATLAGVGARDPKLAADLGRSFASSIRQVVRGTPVSEVEGVTSESPAKEFDQDIMEIYNSDIFGFLSFGTPKLSQAQFKTDLSTLYRQIQAVTNLLSHNYNQIATPPFDHWDFVLSQLFFACSHSDIQSEINQLPDSTTEPANPNVSGDLKSFIDASVTNSIGNSMMEVIIRFNLVPGVAASYHMRAVNLAIEQLKNGTGTAKAVESAMLDAAKFISGSMKGALGGYASNFSNFYTKAIAMIEAAPEAKQEAMLIAISAPMNYMNTLLYDSSLPNPATEITSPYQECSDLEDDVGDDGWQKELFGNPSSPTPPPGTPDGSYSKMSELFLFYIMKGGVSDFSNLSQMVSDFSQTLPWDSTNTNESQVQNALADMLSVFSSM